jgi:adenylate cyclase class 1
VSDSIYLKNRQSWRKYNALRVKRAFEVNADQGRLAFHVIPYLLSVNHPALPGYVSDHAFSTGIYLYNPGETEENALRKSFPKFDFRTAEGARRSGGLIVESIMIMGSIGSIAQTKKSDYDYWIVVDESKRTKNELDGLRAKLAAAEKWAADQKMEIHFFIMDMNKARRNEFGATDKESSGSSQAYLLKEEFYRTAILVAGKDPMWWLFPPGISEEEYSKHKRVMLAEGELTETEVVDLGGTGPIPPGELFGALLWQFNKAMVSPHKSALKMALMETYLMADESCVCICDLLKQLAQDGSSESLERADPYLVMFEFIHDFYKSRGHMAVLLSLEKCFFIKCMDGPVAGSDGEKKPAYKDIAMRRLMKQWSWDSSALNQMNTYWAWDFKKLASLASSLHGFMLEVYKRLTDQIATRPNVKTLITGADLTVLGRKLFTLYAKKPGKIEYLKRVKDEAERLEAISFATSIKPGLKPVWTVYKSNITSSVAKGMDVENQAINKSADPVELMMWLTQNRIYSKGSFLYYIPNQRSPVSLKDLQLLLEMIHDHFPSVSLADLKSEDLVGKTVVKRMVVVVNLLTDRWKREVETLHTLYQTSYGEAFCYVENYLEGMSRILSTLNETGPNFRLGDPALFDIFVPAGENQLRLKKQAMDFLSQKFTPLKRRTLAGK